MDALFAAVKNYLDITWEDPEGDSKLSGFIARGIAHIDRVAGVPQEYETEGKARALLFDYCRYARDGALDEFEANYMHELLALQIDNQVSTHQATEEEQP